MADWLARLSLLLTLMLAGLAVACGGGSASAPTPSPSLTPRPTPTVDRCAELAKRQITVCPPVDLPIPKVPVVDKTNGLLTAQQLRNEAEAVERWFALDYWALGNSGASLLKSPIMVAPGVENQEFGVDLSFLDRADRQGGTLRVLAPYRLTGLVAVPLSEAVRQIATKQGLAATDHGWVYTSQGPAHIILQVPGKPDEVLFDAPSNEMLTLLLLGSPQRDQILGWVWQAGGDYSCTDPQQTKVIRDACLR